MCIEVLVVYVPKTAGEETSAVILVVYCTAVREVIFSDIRKKQTVLPPAPLPGITRDTSLKILGVTITGNLSASDHIRE